MHPSIIMATNGSALKRYVIVRQIPDIGSSTAEGLGLACKKSNSTISSLNHNVQCACEQVPRN